MIREDILQQFPELFGSKNINGREAVSYTHLDVYKRQLPGRP